MKKASVGPAAGRGALTASGPVTLETSQRPASLVSGRLARLEVGWTPRPPFEVQSVADLEPSEPGYGAGVFAVFSQTETCFVLSLVKGVRSQSPHRWLSVIPASRAMRSSSEGHT